MRISFPNPRKYRTTSVPGDAGDLITRITPCLGFEDDLCRTTSQELAVENKLPPTKEGPHHVPIRIYAFAKELGLDNKQLLDICEEANIKGKGSALASLDDDEVATIKEFMARGSQTPAEPAPDPAAPVRPAPFRPAPTKKKIGEIVTPQTKAETRGRRAGTRNSTSRWKRTQRDVRQANRTFAGQQRRKFARSHARQNCRSR